MSQSRSRSRAWVAPYIKSTVKIGLPRIVIICNIGTYHVLPPIHAGPNRLLVYCYLLYYYNIIIVAIFPDPNITRTRTTPAARVRRTTCFVRCIFNVHRFPSQYPTSVSVLLFIFFRSINADRI